jgi:pimeloyl-ACP methyl ester carboxylesterase
MTEDSAQAERSRHHRAFREEGAIARMRKAELAPLREAILAQGVSAGNARIYLETLMQPGGIEGAMAWYRASGVAAADTPPVVVPTLYIWGEVDATVGRRAAELTAAFVAASYRFVPMEGAGHFLVDQFPDRVSALIVDHLRERTAAS